MKPWNGAQDVVFSKAKGGVLPNDLVTVCISAFNYDHYVISALHSILFQSHVNIELIVVDDASEDDTLVVAKEWMTTNAKRFWRSLLLTNRRNQGPSLTRNAAFERASGRYVFVIDADNEAYPRAIAELYRVAVEGGFDAVYPQLETFGLSHGLGHADLFDQEALRAANYIDVMALISKAAWKAVEGFSHLELGWEDYDFWLKFAKAGFEAGYVAEILCRYRLHGSSRTDVDALPAHETLRQLMALRHPSTPA